jgi:hypothetical protein
MRKVCLLGVVCLMIGFAGSGAGQSHLQLDPGLLNDILNPKPLNIPTAAETAKQRLEPEQSGWTTKRVSLPLTRSAALLMDNNYLLYALMIAFGLMMYSLFRTAAKDLHWPGWRVVGMGIRDGKDIVVSVSAAIGITLLSASVVVAVGALGVWAFSTGPNIFDIPFAQLTLGQLFDSAWHGALTLACGCFAFLMLKALPGIFKEKYGKEMEHFRWVRSRRS